MFIYLQEDLDILWRSGLDTQTLNNIGFYFREPDECNGRLWQGLLIRSDGDHDDIAAASTTKFL